MTFLMMLCFLYLFCKSWNNRNGKKSTPPTNWPIIGMTPGLLLNAHHIHDYVTDLLETTGMTFEVKGPWFANLDSVVTCDTANIHYILSRNSKNFSKGPDFKKIFDIFGGGIVSAEFESWEIKRRTLMPLLNHRGSLEFIATITRIKVEKGLMPVLNQFAKLGIDADLQGIFQRLTFDSSCILVLDHDPATLSTELSNFPYEQAFADVEEAILYRHLLPEKFWKLQRWLQIGKEKKLSRAWLIIDEFLAHYKSEKSEKFKSQDNKDGNSDLITGYMEAMEEKLGANEVPENSWRDMALNLIIAGKDTVAAALTWFFWLLAKNPIEENKIRQEIITTLHLTIANGTRKDSHLSEDGVHSTTELHQEVIKKLIYLHAALCEVLRLFPPLGFQRNSPLEADILPSGHRIKPNTKTGLSFYSMARMEKIWGKDCLEFKPERWITEGGGIKHVPSFMFTAFNAGPRTCIGKEISFIQMKIVAAAVIYHFQIKPVEGHPISPANTIILNMKHGFKVKVFRRCDL